MLGFWAGRNFGVDLFKNVNKTAVTVNGYRHKVRVEKFFIASS